VVDEIETAVAEDIGDCKGVSIWMQFVFCDVFRHVHTSEWLYGGVISMALLFFFPTPIAFFIVEIQSYADTSFKNGHRSKYMVR
jgi:hypothetical protein